MRNELSILAACVAVAGLSSSEAVAGSLLGVIGTPGSNSVVTVGGGSVSVNAGSVANANVSLGGSNVASVTGSIGGGAVTTNATVGGSSNLANVNLGVGNVANANATVGGNSLASLDVALGLGSDNGSGGGTGGGGGIFNGPGNILIGGNGGLDGGLGGGGGGGGIGLDTGGTAAGGGLSAACRAQAGWLKGVLQQNYGARQFASLGSATGVQVVKAGLCSQFRSALTRAAQTNGKLINLQAAVARDPLATISLQRQHSSPGKVIGIAKGQQGNVVIYTF